MDAAAEGRTSSRVLDEIATKGDFPATGLVIQRLREVVAREDCTALDIARVILHDPGLSSKVLRLVNSAFYRQRSNPVSTITRAVILLGFQAIRDLTAGLLLIEEFTRQGRSSQYVREGVGRALLAAMVAQSLAAKAGVPASEEAYLLGLFANVGNLWLAAFYPDEFEAARAFGGDKGIALDQAVGKKLGLTPQTLAAAILEHWNFPPSYAEYFRHRAARARLQTASGGDRLAVVVDLAAEYAAGVAEEGARPPVALLERAQALVGLGSEAFAAAARTAGEALREQAPVLGIAPLPGRVSAASAGLGADAHGAAPAAKATTPASGAPRAISAVGDPAAALAILTEVTTSLVEGCDLDQTLSMICEGIAHVGGFELVLLALPNPDRTTLTVRVACGGTAYEALRTLTVPLRASGGLLAETALAGTPSVLSRATAAALVPEGVPPPAIPDSTVVTLPVVLHGEVTGVLIAARSADVPAGPGDLPLIQLFANQAGLALARA